MQWPQPGAMELLDTVWTPGDKQAWSYQAIILAVHGCSYVVFMSVFCTKCQFKTHCQVMSSTWLTFRNEDWQQMSDKQMKHLKTSETRDGISWARVNRGTDISPPKKHNALPSLFKSFICPSKATKHWNWYPPKPRKRTEPKHQTCGICSCIPARPWFLQSRRPCPVKGFQPTQAKFVKPNSKSSAEFPFQRNIETQHVSLWESALNKMRYCPNRLTSSTHPSATRWAQCASSSGPKTFVAKTLQSRRLESRRNEIFTRHKIHPSAMMYNGASRFRCL